MQSNCLLDPIEEEKKIPKVEESKDLKLREPSGEQSEPEHVEDHDSKAITQTEKAVNTSVFSYFLKKHLRHKLLRMMEFQMLDNAFRDDSLVSHRQLNSLDSAIEHNEINCRNTFF